MRPLSNAEAFTRLLTHRVLCHTVRPITTPPADPVLLHFGCTSAVTADALSASVSVALSEYSIKDKPRASVYVSCMHNCRVLAHDSLAGLTLTLLPDKQFRVQTASPPPALPLIAEPCDSPWCSIFTEWLEDPNSKFMQLWGPTSWRMRARGDAGCWETLGGETFFDHALAGTWCDRNWMEGGYGSEADRPDFGAPAPALLGFDTTIWEYCSRESGLAHVKGFSQQELATRCIRSHNNILRMVASKWQWNMCQNLVWQLCVVQGKLPGQGSSQLRFAPAPKHLEMREWEHPTSWPCGNGACPAGRYAVGDVYYAEIAVFRWICHNSATLFHIENGTLMECDLDRSAFQKLRHLLMAK